MVRGPGLPVNFEIAVCCFVTSEVAEGQGKYPEIIGLWEGM